MRVGTFNATHLGSVDHAVGWSRAAAEAGFDTVWFPQVLGLDALTALAVVAREVPDVHLGTAVVPIQGRHPLPLAFQALTVASAAGPQSDWSPWRTQTKRGMARSKCMSAPPTT